MLVKGRTAIDGFVEMASTSLDVAGVTRVLC